MFKGSNNYMIKGQDVACIVINVKATVMVKMTMSNVSMCILRSPLLCGDKMAVHGPWSCFICNKVKPRRKRNSKTKYILSCYIKIISNLYDLFTYDLFFSILPSITLRLISKFGLTLPRKQSVI